MHRVSGGKPLPFGSPSLNPGGSEPARPLRLRDYVQIVNTVLYLVLGLAIMIRVTYVHLTLLGLFIGGGFLALGIYRTNMIWNHFQQRR